MSSKQTDCGNITPPFETMTKGRVYATVSNQYKLKPIVFFDKQNKRYKQVDVDHTHKINGEWTQPHTHKGYEHNEMGNRQLTDKEHSYVNELLKKWETKRKHLNM